MRAWAVCALVLCIGCGGSSSETLTESLPQLDVAGTWEWRIGEFACALPQSLLTEDQTFSINGGSGTFSANFTDPFGNTVEISGSVTNGFVSGTVTLTVPSPSTVQGAVDCPGATAYIVDPDNDEYHVLDLETLERTTNALFTEPQRPCALPDGSKVYIPTAGSDDLAVIDTATGEVVNRIPGTTGAEFNGATGCVVSPDGSRLYVANPQSFFQGQPGFVTVIDTATDTGIGRIDLTGTGAVDLDISSDGETLVVINDESSTIDIIDLTTGTFGAIDETVSYFGTARSAALAGDMLVVAGDPGIEVPDSRVLTVFGFDVAVSEDETTAFVTQRTLLTGFETVEIYDVASGGLTGFIDAGPENAAGIDLCANEAGVLAAEGRVEAFIFDAGGGGTENTFTDIEGDWVIIVEQQAQQQPARMIVAVLDGIAIETSLGTMLDGTVRIDTDTGDPSCQGSETTFWVRVDD